LADVRAGKIKGALTSQLDEKDGNGWLNRILWDNIGRLTLETSVLSIVLIHLISSEAKTASDTEAWLRAFADEVYSSVDSAPIPPVSIQASVEQARARVDLLMQAVRLHLARK
jgi:hypothetical protein